MSAPGGAALDSALSSPPGGPAGRPRRQRLLSAALALILGLSILCEPAFAAEAPSDDQLRSELERVRQEREGLSGELSEVEQRQRELSSHLQAATDRVAELDAELGRLLNETEALTAEVADLEAQMATAAEGLRGRIRELYKGAGAPPLLEFAIGDSPEDLTRRSGYLMALSRHDQTELEVAVGIGRILARRRGELDAATAATQEVAAQARDARAELDLRLAQSAELAAQVQSEIATRDVQGQALVAELDERQRQREEAARLERERQAEAARQARERELAELERQRQAEQQAAAAPVSSGGTAAPANPAPPPATGGMVCPQDHPRSFSDTWGAPRSGGRRHRGTDIFGARGGAVFAITGGVVQSARSGALSGLFLSLRGDDGHVYWYMHLQDFVASPGQRVGAGELIAHNGDTGNARGTTPHIHFEYHPGGGVAVNPYPLLRQVCG
ncbi:MAG TPA: peptidoglycan DD-metalloendopeptidase family protein [Egibacteraceae bacterium]|nr:peptidoglycan DD-metalloendopeptidase family protein [Egibacteraceae bacterium]